MRISGGMAAGRLLKVPKGFSVRPTPDLVKQAVFNSLGGWITGLRVLELFAGSGALGLECLSRGAMSVVAIERASRHAILIRENVQATGLPAHRYQLRTQDVFHAIAQLAENGQRFDLIMADPPFGEKNIGKRSESLSQQLLDDPALPRLLEAEGLLVLGHTKRDTLTLTASWEEAKCLKHGDSVMRFLRRREAEPTVPNPGTEAGL